MSKGFLGISQDVSDVDKHNSIVESMRRMACFGMLSKALCKQLGMDAVLDEEEKEGNENSNVLDMSPPPARGKRKRKDTSSASHASNNNNNINNNSIKFSLHL